MSATMEETSKSADPTPPVGEAFARLFAENQRRIFAFILTLLPSREDAEDVFQDVSVVLWRKSAQFDTGQVSPGGRCKSPISKSSTTDERRRDPRYSFTMSYFGPSPTRPPSPIRSFSGVDSLLQAASAGYFQVIENSSSFATKKVLPSRCLLIDVASRCELSTECSRKSALNCSTASIGRSQNWGKHERPGAIGQASGDRLAGISSFRRGLDEQSRARLEVLLQTDPAARETYRRMVELEAELGWLGPMGIRQTTSDRSDQRGTRRGSVDRSGDGRSRAWPPPF